MAAKSATVVVGHEIGLHARPVSVFAQTASRLEMDIPVRKAGGEMEIDARNSIAVLPLGVGPDEEIVITADGNNGEQAVKRFVELIRSDLDLDT